MTKTTRDAASLELIGGRLCLDFVNTATARGSAGYRDYLPAYGALVAWGRHAGAISATQAPILIEGAAESPQAAKDALDSAIALREAVYRLLCSAVAKHQPPAAELSCLNRELRDAGIRQVLLAEASGFEWGWEFEPRDLNSVLWPVVRSAAALLTSPELSRVRQCARPGCQWFFLDESKNGSRRWCTMAVCGSRVKSQRFYRRSREKAPRAARG
jgi:predicted RNA-binding Zn ribbon-like protein